MDVRIIAEAHEKLPCQYFSDVALHVPKRSESGCWKPSGDDDAGFGVAAQTP
jgi:hypothetical protein